MEDLTLKQELFIVTINQVSSKYALGEQNKRWQDVYRIDGKTRFCVIPVQISQKKTVNNENQLTL